MQTHLRSVEMVETDAMLGEGGLDDIAVWSDGAAELHFGGRL
jgi:hypothetical protein